jgi:hypothetical protein
MNAGPVRSQELSPKGLQGRIYRIDLLADDLFLRLQTLQASQVRLDLLISLLTPATLA